jgi:hypothetical protein
MLALRYNDEPQRKHDRMIGEGCLHIALRMLDEGKRLARRRRMVRRSLGYSTPKLLRAPFERPRDGLVPCSNPPVRCASVRAELLMVR